MQQVERDLAAGDATNAELQSQLEVLRQEHAQRMHLAQRDVKALERVKDKLRKERNAEIQRQEQELGDEKSLRRAAGHE